MTPSSAETETLQIISSCGALLLEDHFVYASGDHGSGWIAKDLVSIRPALTMRLGALLAQACADLEPAPELVCGPAIGGLLCGHATAFAMELPFVYAEHHPGESTPTFELRRGFGEVVAGREVLVVDDVVNTGFSIGLVIRAVREAGGRVGTAATWVDRGSVDAAGLGVDRFIRLVEIDLPSWPESDCPLCAQRVPINTRYAHGAEYLEAHSSGDAHEVVD